MKLPGEKLYPTLTTFDDLVERFEFLNGALVEGTTGLLELVGLLLGFFNVTSVGEGFNFLLSDLSDLGLPLGSTEVTYVGFIAIN